MRASLGLATAQICQGLGWHSVHRSSHDILTDILERYLSQVSKTAANISQTCKQFLLIFFIDPLIVKDDDIHF